MIRSCIVFFLLMAASLTANIIDVEYSAGTKIRIVSLDEGRKDPVKILRSMERSSDNNHIDKVYLVTAENGTVNSMVIIYQEGTSITPSKEFSDIDIYQ